LQTTILTTDAEFDALRPEWDELLEASAQRVFFLRWHWNRTWWRFYAPPGSHLLLVTCRDAGGRLVGLAPFYLQTRRYFGVVTLREVCFLGTGTALKTSEYLDIIARRGSETAVGAAAAAALRARGGWDRLWLWCVPVESATVPAFRAALGTGGTQAMCDRAHVIDTSGDWERTKRSFRHDVDRAIRQALGEPGSRVTRVQSVEELEPALDDLVRVHQARWRTKGQPGSFAFPHFDAFLRQVARDSFEHGRLGLWRLTLGGTCAAALIAFVDFGTVHYFQSGFDPDSPHSLGQVMVGLAIRDCVAAEQITCFDLMGGRAAYKDEWTTAFRETLEFEYLPAGVRSTVFVLARAVRERLARVRRAYRARGTRGARGVPRTVR
jgi:CelD/BcsL family acetyltransferase involved in cellulose biosynthesis